MKFLRGDNIKQLFRNIQKPLSRDKCVGEAGRGEDGGGSEGDRLQVETTGGHIRHFENNGIIVSEGTEFSLQSKNSHSYNWFWARE